MADLAQSVLGFAPPRLPAGVDRLRHRVREVLRDELEKGTWGDSAGSTRTGRSWGSFCPELSRRLGAEGFIGMTWPKHYGGQERSYLERYVVTEELLAAGAPTGAHWVADRQSGPLILRFGTEEQKEKFLPPITRGESYFSIGMSEPDSGSDLASIRTRADRVDGGFRVNGTKIWTSAAHRNHYLIALCRTSPPSAERHAGMSQLIIDLKTEGITIRPIKSLAGEHGFNEVVFQDVFVPDLGLIGELGSGWSQVTSELAYERAGPERFLTSYHLLVEVLTLFAGEADAALEAGLGRLISRLWALRKMSLSVAGRLERGEAPAIESALVKDLGTQFEQQLPEALRELLVLSQKDPGRLGPLLGQATLAAPAYTIQGGTTEILRGIVARGLGLR